jgi:hypothetical protein
MAVLDYVLDLMDLDLEFRGRRLERPSEALHEGIGFEGDF